MSGLDHAPRKKPARKDADGLAYALLKIGTNTNQQTRALNTLLIAGEAPGRALSDSITRTHAELAAIVAKLRTDEG